MKVIIDDTAKFIEWEDFEISLHQYDFYKGLLLLLTDKQHCDFVANDTHRTFQVSNKRLEEFKKFIGDIKQPI